MEKMCIVYGLGPYMIAMVIPVLSHLSTQVGAMTSDMAELTKKLESLPFYSPLRGDFSNDDSL